MELNNIIKRTFVDNRTRMWWLRSPHKIINDNGIGCISVYGISKVEDCVCCYGSLCNFWIAPFFVI